jgi:integrase
MPAQPKKVRGVFEKHPGSGVWWICYKGADGKIHRETAGTKVNAGKLYHKRKTEALSAQKLPEIQKAKLTFSLIAKDRQDYLDTLPHRAGSDDARIKLLTTLFGDMRADSITPEVIEDKLAEIATKRKWKPATTNRHKAVLSAIFQRALKNKKIAGNPARLVGRLKEDNSVIRFLSVEEQTRLEFVLTPERWAIVKLALNTGCRAGELWRAKWPDVNRTTALLTLPKTKNGTIRHIPLNSDALNALDVLEKAEQADGYILPRDPYRFWFESAVTAAKIVNFRFHDLRHTFASRCTMQGVGPVALAELLGHKSLAMVFRYSHLAPKHLADAVSKLVGFGLETTSTATSTKSAVSS